jgi:hypothetical protein
MKARREFWDFRKFYFFEKKILDYRKFYLYQNYYFKLRVKQRKLLLLVICEVTVLAAALALALYEDGLFWALVGGGERRLGQNFHIFRRRRTRRAVAPGGRAAAAAPTTTGLAAAKSWFLIFIK